EELPMVEVVIGEDEQVAVKEEQLTQIITAQEKSTHEEEIAERIENIVITPQNDENVAEENEQANVEVENNQENEETSEEQNTENEKNDEEADKENERIEENAKDDEVFEEDEQNDKQEKSLTVVPETPEKTLVEELDRSNLRTAIETTKNKTFSVFSDSSISSVDTPSTPVGPPKKRRKSEVSIHLLQSLRKSNPVLLTRTPYLDADVPILSPRVTGFNKTSKRIHSTPKSSAGGSMDFTFGPDFSMI
uniref:Uncharacterized protein n=1 Tax=Panagrolaimus sp. JU765 TaxID=591449 RepID=A0AC34RFE9_9BILA